jgi:hypothetical protein
MEKQKHLNFSLFFSGFRTQRLKCIRKRTGFFTKCYFNLQVFKVSAQLFNHTLYKSVYIRILNSPVQC